MNEIQGSGGGKGGGGQTFREDENTLRSNVIVSTIEAWGEGPIVGPVLGAKSIFLDNTPLQNSDGTFNYGGKVGFAVRTGLPDQTEVPGFEATGDPITVNTEIVIATPVVRTVTDAAVTTVGLTISLPQGLYNQDTSNNALTATEVQLAVDVKLSASGTWVQQRLIAYNDKTTSPYQETFRIDRPAGSGLWDIRVRRLTPDNASSTLRNNTFWAYHTEMQLLGVTYPDIAYMAVTVDAASVNSSQIPTRSAEIYGLIVQVPVNYNEITRTYSGIWNGTFKNAWTNDPAWVLYAICTNTRWGLGLDASQVDKFSFYEASVYNSALLSFTNRVGTTSIAPRFSFNYQISQGQIAPEMLNQVASVMNAKVMWVGGQITVLQDRPEPIAHMFTRASIVGLPVYKGSALQQRNTVANVTWNDPESQYQQRVVSVEDAEYLASYGYNPVNVAAYGCTSEAQAIRFGKWYLYTVLRTAETVTFTIGIEGQLVVPHEIIELYDNDYTGLSASGRVKAGCTTTSIVLDRTVNLSADAKIDIAYPDGTLVLDQNIVTTGNASTITLNSALAVAPPEYSQFIIKTNSVEPRQFRVSKVTALDNGQFRIEANQYDSSKYSFVETGVSQAAPVFSAIRPNVVGSPTNLFLTERVIYVDNKINRSLTASWSAPNNTDLIARYQVTYRVNGGELVTVSVPTTFFEIEGIVPGVTEVRVYAVSFRDVLSTPLVGRYTVAATETTGSTLDAPTTLQVAGGGTTFSGRALTFEWTNPSSNGVGDTSVSDFKVEVYTTADVLLRSEYVAQVAPGNTQSFSYDYDKNLVDGGPRRSVKVKVYARDGNKKLSGAATATFSNPAPGALSSFTATGGIGNMLLEWLKPLDTDLVGVLVWRGSTGSFTPDSSNLVGDTTGTALLNGGLSASTPYYYKAAAYDAFGRPTDGAGLNISLAMGDTLTLASAGIPSGATTPADGSGIEGDLFFNTTDGKLYRYHAGVWTTAVPTVDLTGVIVSGQIGTAEVKTANIDTSAITDVKLGTGSVTELKLGTSSVTTGKIADLAVTNSKIAVGAIQAQQLSVAIGGGNLLGNSKFQAGTTTFVPGVGAFTTPTGWRAYNPGGVAHSTSNSAGFMVQATASGTGLGIRTDYTYEAPYGGVGSLLPLFSTTGSTLDDARELDRTRFYGPKFMLSINANKINGASLTNLTPVLFGSGWSGATITAVNNPSLTADVQRYTWLITAPAAAIGNTIDGFAVQVNGSFVSGDVVQFGNALLNEGDLTGSWQPRVEELVPGTIIGEYIQADSISTSKLQALSVSTDKLQANSITAAKIAANAVTASQIAVTDLTNYLMNGAFSTGIGYVDPVLTAAQQAGLNWSFAGGAEVTETSIPASAPTRFVLKLPQVTGLPVAQAFANVDNTTPPGGQVYVDVAEDQPLWFSARVIKTGTVDASAVILVTEFSTASGGTLSYVNSVLDATTSWSTINGQITVPAGAALARFSIRRGEATGSGTWYGSSFEVRKKNAGKLIVDGAIVTNLLAANAVTAEKIQAGSIETDKLAANSITSDKIVANAITAGKIAASAIEADKLAVNSVTADKIVANTITAAQIADATITNAKIVDATLTGAKLADASITNAKIGGALTSDTFNGTVTAGVITAIGTAGWAMGKDGKMVLEATVFRNNKASAAQARGYIYSGAAAVSNVSGGRGFAALTVPNDAVGQTGANGYLTVYIRSSAARRAECAFWIRAVSGGTTIDMPAVITSHHLQGGEEWTATSPTTYVYRIPMSLNWLYSGSYYVSTGTLRPGTSGILPVPALFDNLLLAGSWSFSLETSVYLYDMSSNLASEIDYVTMAAAGYAIEHRGVQPFVPTSPFI